MTTTNTRHTPGPWHSEKMRAPNGGTYYRVFTDRDKDAAPHEQVNGPVAQVFCDYGGFGTPDGNAHLIAAAPDLLAALEVLMHAVDPYSTGPDDVEPYFRAPMDAARAAIAKARGEA